MSGADDTDVETLRTARAEAQRTLDAQLSTLDDIDAKAVTVFRLNVALAGLLFSALSFAAGAEIAGVAALLNVVTGGGVLLFVLSAALAAFTYTVTGQQVGAGPAGLRGTEGVSERAYLERLIEGYAEWIRYNERTNVHKALLVTLSVLGTVAGALALALGAAVAFAGFVTVSSAFAVLGLLLLPGVWWVSDHLRRVFEGEASPGTVTPQSLDEPMAGQRTFKGRDRDA